MILSSIITFQNGEFNYTSPDILNFLAIIISIIATIIAYLAARFQILSLLQNQLADKAKECNTNLDPETHMIIIKLQNISHVVSTIITTEYLIERVLKQGRLLLIRKQSLIDQFYLQLHTSIIDYIRKNKITPAFEDGIVKYHVELQLEHCHNLFTRSIEKYGNATPKEINDKLEAFKKNNN